MKPQTTPEHYQHLDKIRGALELLSDSGYDIYHKGQKLLRQGRCWTWIKPQLITVEVNDVRSI